MLRTLGNAVSNAASTVAGGVGRLVDVRPTYKQIGNFVVKGASYESFDSSGLFGSLSASSLTSGISGDSSGYFSSLSASSLTSGISGDSSGYFSSMQGLQGMGQIGNGLWGASGGTDASDGSGGGISSYLPSGQSTGIFFGISAVLALIPVALILNHMIFMPLVLRIFVAIFVYAACVVNPFLAIPIYLYYIVLMMIHWKAKSPYLLFPFFGLWPLRPRQPTDGALLNFFTWPFSYLDPDLSKERHVNQRIEYEAGAKLYAKSLADTLQLPAADVQKLGIDGLRDKVFQGLMSVVRGQEQAKVAVEQVKAAAEAVAATGAAVAGTVAAVVAANPTAEPAKGNTERENVPMRSTAEGKPTANTLLQAKVVPLPPAEPRAQIVSANLAAPVPTVTRPSAVTPSAVTPSAEKKAANPNTTLLTGRFSR